MRIGYTLASWFMRFQGMFPLGYHYFWGRVISFFLRNVMHYRRDVVLINLSRAFPTKKYKEICEIEKQFYRHLGEIFAEAIWFGGCRNSERLRKSHLCEFPHPETLADAYNNAPSVLVLASHAGNWELFGGLFESLYDGATVPFDQDAIIVVYKQLKNLTWDAVFKDTRCAPLRKPFEGYVESDKVLRTALMHRHDKKVYLFPTDQSPYKHATVHHVKEFMHQPTVTMTGGAALANKFHMSVGVLGMKRDESGKYIISFDEICRDASQYTPEQIMEMYYAKLEEQINEQPWNYLWTHKRWKNKNLLPEEQK